MDELSNTLLKIYLENLNFLEKNFPDIFKKIAILSEAIDTGRYKERYSLEYKDDSYFDIKDIENDHLIYGKNSFNYSEDITKFVEMDSDNTISILPKKNNRLALPYGNNDIKNMVNYLNNRIDFNNIKFITINKYIFCGVGLGLHINYIFDKIKPLNIYIIEPDLELFRLSLFVTNYSNFQYGDHKLFLSIGDEEKERRDILTSFYEYHPYMNYYIKYNIFSNSYRYLLDEIVNFLSHIPLKQIVIDYDFITIDRTLELYNKDYKFLSSKFLDNRFFSNGDNRCLVLAGGPSLDKNIDWIKDIKDKLYIISVDLIVPKLLEYGIIPDLIVALDPNQSIYEIFKGIDKNILKDLRIVVSSHVENRTIKLFSKENVFVSQALVVFEEIGDIVVGDNVGTFGLSIAILLKFKTIYTLGNDASYDEDSGKFYSSGSLLENISIEKNMNHSLDGDITTKDIIRVKGNFKESVPTTRKFLNFRDVTEEAVTQYIERWGYNTNLYNLSDGAYIRGLEPLRLEDIDLYVLDKKDSSRLYVELDQFVEIGFRNNIEHDMKLIKAILKDLKKFKKQKTYEINSFLTLKVEITNNILKNMETIDIFIYKIFTRLLAGVDNYVNFYLSLDSEKKDKDIERLKELWMAVFDNIFNDLYRLLYRKLNSKK